MCLRSGLNMLGCMLGLTGQLTGFCVRVSIGVLYLYILVVLGLAPDREPLTALRPGVVSLSRGAARRRCDPGMPVPLAFGWCRYPQRGLPSGTCRCDAGPPPPPPSCRPSMAGDEAKRSCLLVEAVLCLLASWALKETWAGLRWYPIRVWSKSGGDVPWTFVTCRCR